MIIGKTDYEKKTEDLNVARNIVKEITRFGVNDVQRQAIIYYISLELEDAELMTELCAVMRALGKCFITDQEEQ